jgi:hypothetical protein
LRFFEEFSIFEVFVFFFWARRLDKKWSPSSTLHFPLLREGCGISQKSTVPARPDQSLYVTMHPTDFPPCVSTPGGRSAHRDKTLRIWCGIAGGIRRTFYLPRGTIIGGEKRDSMNFFCSKKFFRKNNFNFFSLLIPGPGSVFCDRFPRNRSRLIELELPYGKQLRSAW